MSKLLAGTPVSRLWGSGAIGAVLLLASWQAVDTLSRTPAFNPALQVETVTGDGRTPLGSAMYHRGDYLHQAAFGYRNAMTHALFTAGFDAFMERYGEIDAETGRPRATFEEEVSEAIRLSEESLRVAPGNALVWTLLASSHVALGQIEPALAAYRRSGDLAPLSPALAEERLRFLEALATEAGRPDLLSELLEQGAAARDLATLRRNAPAVLADLLSEGSPLGAADLSLPDARGREVPPNR